MNAAKVLVWHPRAKGESIIPAVDECWLKKVRSMCNRYILHGGCSVDVSKKESNEARDEIYRELGELKIREVVRMAEYITKRPRLTR